MKKARWMMISALLIAGMAQAERVTLDKNTPTKVANWYAYYTDGKPAGIATGGVGSNTNIVLVSVGAGGAGASQNLRGGLDFNVSGQQTITNATLKIYMTKTTPSYDMAVYAKTVNGTLNTTVALAKAAYSDSNYVDTGLRIATTAVSGTWFAFDVTSYVTNAVANGGNVSFRFQMLNDTNLTFGTADRYQIGSFKTTETAPSLDLYTIPEPITVGLFELLRTQWISECNPEKI